MPRPWWGRARGGQRDLPHVRRLEPSGDRVRLHAYIRGMLALYTHIRKVDPMVDQSPQAQGRAELLRPHCEGSVRRHLRPGCRSVTHALRKSLVWFAGRHDCWSTPSGPAVRYVARACRDGGVRVPRSLRPLLLAALLAACSSPPGLADGDWRVRGEPGDVLDLVCESTARCYAAALDTCEPYEELCRGGPGACDLAGPEPGVHLVILCGQPGGQPQRPEVVSSSGNGSGEPD